MYNQPSKADAMVSLFLLVDFKFLKKQVKSVN